MLIVKNNLVICQPSLSKVFKSNTGFKVHLNMMLLYEIFIKCFILFVLINWVID